jgi:hypothetical protein
VHVSPFAFVHKAESHLDPDAASSRSIFRFDQRHPSQSARRRAQRKISLFLFLSLSLSLSGEPIPSAAAATAAAAAAAMSYGR